MLYSSEYTVINHIVYSLDIDELTATVVNFQTPTDRTCHVTIPETIWYKEDKYNVAGIALEDFNYNDLYLASYLVSSLFDNALIDYNISNKANETGKMFSDFQYDYQKARANITYLDIPNTVIVIRNGAFSGMTRLKELTIPASVVALYSYSNENIRFPRLEKVSIGGIPSLITWGTVIDPTIQDSIGNFTYISEVAKAFVGIDPNTGKSEMCPNLKSFSMPAAKKAIEKAIDEKRKNELLCDSVSNFYNLALERECEEYNKKLAKHPYYDGTLLSSNKVKWNRDTCIIRKDYLEQTQKLSHKYDSLVNGEMEARLRKNNVEQYIKFYQIVHPEKKAAIDSLALEFRCWDKGNFHKNVILNFIDGRNIDLHSCRQKYYVDYGDLFADKEEFDKQYDSIESDSDFRAEIEKRIAERNLLNLKKRKVKRYMNDSKDIKFQGVLSPKHTFHDSFEIIYENMRTPCCYEEFISSFLSINTKAAKEYGRNSRYFKDKKEFFEAYITPEYKKILKSNKQRLAN